MDRIPGHTHGCMEAYAIRDRRLAESRTLQERLREILDGGSDTRLYPLRPVGRVEQMLAARVEESGA